MADRLTTIENDIASQLLTIDGTLQPTGYEYYSTVEIVNQEDSTIADIDARYPYINVYLEPDEEVLQGVSRVFENRVKFRLECNVSVSSEADNPRFAINAKMNEIYSDIKFNLSKDGATLGRTVDNVKIVGASRVYDLDNDQWTGCRIDVFIEIVYSQSRNNPNVNICV